MSADPDFISFIEEQLEPLGPLAAGRFFGGHAFKQDGAQFAMVMGNTLYLRVDDETRPGFREENSEPFSYTTKRGRVIVDSYYAAPERLMDDPGDLVAWAREAIGAARRAR